MFYTAHYKGSQAMLTLNSVQESLPVQYRKNISQDMVNQLNALSKDPEEARNIRDNFITFSQVLQEGRYKVGDYVSAVMYVSYKIMGKTNLASYKATFPDRHNSMVKSGKETKDIASIVTAYNKGQLVTKIMERAIVPTWILNQDAFQSAINTQYELMTDVMVSDKVRSDAANSLLTHLKKPEIAKGVELKIDIGLNDGMAALEAQLVKMSRNQLFLIENDPNVSANDIASLPMKTVNP
jgi:hypothetical protein